MRTPYFLALDIDELSRIIGSKDLSSTSSQKQNFIKAACDWLKYDLNLRRIHGPFLSDSLQSFNSIQNENTLRWMQDIAKKDGKKVTFPKNRYPSKWLKISARISRLVAL